MTSPRDAKLGTYDGEPTYCPMNDFDCPYWSLDGRCHIDDPFEDCDEWQTFCEAENWNEWKNL